MKTNELKKGALVHLRNGWAATIADNLKGNTRMATVYGHYTETGSVYAHDIVYVFVPDEGGARIDHPGAQPGVRYVARRIELTDKQKQRLKGGFL